MNNFRHMCVYMYTYILFYFLKYVIKLEKFVYDIQKIKKFFNQICYPMDCYSKRARYSAFCLKIKG